ncbi:IQ domain-containing protein N [Delphinapterus leucas]|uniref:IQ domain-containing protein N n=1 Tax=Delphinapterus leucas TaxID=9749 RepID=A0A2Y9LZC0_DELLE|nr:IQ domain-containing protein N [Delphinapterus leucas]XP_022414160.1 IQ domain-containing protein N [Delphinapterus leucas]XP_022414161.1 IQ domain-containing protein N [Delphinapterus leucas]
MKSDWSSQKGVLLQSRAEPPRNQDNAASNTATGVTQWAELLSAVPNLQDKVGTLRLQLQVSPSGKSSYQPVPSLQGKAGTLHPQPRHEPPASKETLLQQPDKDKTVAHHIPCLRAVVESQAFKNVLVDEMDMMLSHAATLIQANWRGYRLRQKLISQIMVTKAIQEAWRRFNTRCLLQSGKTVEKKAKVEEGDIPYHSPQQVRFQHLEEGKSLLAQPTLVSKETQFPSSNGLAACTHQLALLQSQGMSQPGTCSVGGPSVAFLPHQTAAIRLPCPVSPEAKCRPCLLTRTVRNACLVHGEGDTMKTKQVTAKANKAGAPGPPPSGRCAQAVQGQLKSQTQAHMEAEVLEGPPQTGPAPMITKTPAQTCPQATVTKTPLQSCLAATMNKIQSQPCPVPAITITKTPPQPCPATPVTKTSVQMRPSASMTNTSPRTRPAAMMAKTPPQLCLLPSMFKSPTQTRPAATMTKTPSHQTLQGVSVTKGPPAQTRLAAMVTKTPAQLRSVAAILRTLCLPPPAAGNLKPPSSALAAAGIPDTSSHTCLSGPKAKAVVNARQAAGVTTVSPHSYLTKGKMKCFPPSHLGAGDPKATARPPSEGEKIKDFSQKRVKTETAPNISEAMEVPVVSSWSKVAEDGSKQAHLRTDVVKALSQGPEDNGVSGSQVWNSAVPSVAVGPRNGTAAPGGAWDVMVAVDPRQPGELVTSSAQAVEEIIIHAVVIIQACTRGFLVRRTIKVWHQWAITIQAAWRGYRARRDLARLCRAATVIQAAWRGFCIRRSCTQQMLLPGMWAETGSGARTTSDHHCFQSCHPRVCSLCQSLSSGLGSPPIVVMLVGSSSRTCHICGHTLPTRVLHGTGQGAAGQAGMPRGCITRSNPQSPWQPHHQSKAATAIQSAWRGFAVRCQLKQQQLAAKMLQATWRGHCTRASLTTDALLGPAAWDNSQHVQWPGV